MKKLTYTVYKHKPARLSDYRMFTLEELKTAKRLLNIVIGLKDEENEGSTLSAVLGQKLIL